MCFSPFYVTMQFLYTVELTMIENIRDMKKARFNEKESLNGLAGLILHSVLDKITLNVCYF